MDPSSGRALDPNAVLRMLRIVFAAVLLSLLLYPVVILAMKDRPDAHLDHTFQMWIFAAGMVTGVVVLYLRLVRIPGIFSTSEPPEPRALAGQLLTSFILCYVFSEATALFGFVLAILRGDPRYYIPLYVAGVLLMVSCYPRLPSPDSN